MGLAQIRITEVHPTGSSNGTYNRDWFELTNFGASAVNITGWRMDDNSFSFANSVALLGVTSIDPGQSVVFIEASDLATASQQFIDAWFGGTAPTGFTMGNYSGSGVGLGSGGDAVVIFDPDANEITRVTFGASTAGITFDNAEGLQGAISTLSQVGVNGAFESVTGNEIGSPGTIGSVAVPEPTALALVSAGVVAYAGRRYFQRKGSLRNA